jgi:hypothetical protein
MKKLRLFFFIVVYFMASGVNAQVPPPPPADNPLRDVNKQLHDIFSPLKRPSPYLDYLYDMSGHVTDDKFWTRISYDPSNTDNWYRLYWESYYMAYNNSSLQTSEQIYDDVMNMPGDVIPLGLLDIEYYKLKPNALTTNNYFDFDLKNDLLTDLPKRTDEPYTHENIFTFAPLYHQSNYGLVTWLIDPKFLFIDAFNTNYYNLPYEFFIDFGDGNGFKKIDPTKVTYVTIDYKKSGNIDLKACVKQDGMLVKHSQSTFGLGKTSVSSTAPDSDFEYEDMTVSVYRSCTDPVQKKIVIYLEGMDMLDFSSRLNRNGRDIYGGMIQEPKVSQLRNLGYDFYVVDWHNSRRDMRANAMSVVHLIDRLKGELGNESQFVIIGESMGGVVARYALCFMETPAYTDPYYWPVANQREKMHNTRLLITLDSPHQGANMPLSVQLLYSQFYNAISFGNPMIAKFIANHFDGILYSTAAKQLLIYHVNTQSGGGLYKTYSEDPERTSFVSDLASWGNYPKYTKLMAISNGALNGQMQTRFYEMKDRTPNDNLLDFSTELYAKILWFIKVPIFGADLEMKTNPNGTGQVLQLNAGTWGIRLKFYFFGVKLLTGYNTLFNVSEFADVKPYCTNPGGYFISGLEKVVGASTAPGTDWELSKQWLFNLASYKSGSDGNGCWSTQAHLGLDGFSSNHFNVSICSDGMQFCFVPVQSALDYGVLGSGPLNPDIESEPISTILSNTPFDVIVGNASTDSWFMGTHNLNRSHLYVKYKDNNQAALSEMKSEFPYCGLNSNIWGHWINREIGDYLLYLENLDVNWNCSFEGARGILINSHNPWYTYPSQTGSHNGFYSREDAFQILGSNFVDFQYDMYGIPPGPFVYNLPVTGSWTTSQSNALCISCSNYGRMSPVTKTNTTENNTSFTSEIYPNPSDANGTLVIHSTKTTDADLVITIRDIVGRIITEKKIDREEKNMYTTIPLSSLNLANGLYVVTIGSGAETNVHKLVIQ